MTEQPQDAMQQDQAEQGLAQQEFDDELIRIMRKMAHQSMTLSTREIKTLCNALKIDVRDVT